jgi:hypothetical protein
MLPRTEEECSIDEWISVVDEKTSLAEATGHPAHPEVTQRGQNVRSQLVSTVTVVLHLTKITKPG